MKNQIKNICIYSLIVASVVNFPTTVNSAQQGVSFGGFVGLGRFCNILLTQNGTLAPNVSRTQLSSLEAAGVAGRAQIRTSLVTSGPQYIISVEAPTAFTNAPSALSAPVDFGVTYTSTFEVFSGNDPHGNPNTTPISSGSLSELSSTTRLRFPRNATRLSLDVHLDASTSTGTFPAGEYAAEVVLRCE